jgi:hypothetical protein
MPKDRDDNEDHDSLGHFVTIRSAKAGEVFRGVALAPEEEHEDGHDHSEAINGAHGLRWSPRLDVYWPGEPAAVLPWMKRSGQHANLYHLTFRGTCLIIGLGGGMTRKNQEIAPQ